MPLTSQGVLAGIGQGMALPLFMSLPAQWFYRRRGLASGIAMGGAGLGGGISVLICRQLTISYGYKRTLLYVSHEYSLISTLTSQDHVLRQHCGCDGIHNHHQDTT